MDFSRPFEVNVSEMLEELVPGYLEKRRADVVILKELVQKEDFVELKSMGHKMAGNAGGYGFMGLSEIGFVMEEEADKKNAAAISDMITHMENYLNNVNIVIVEDE